MSTVNRPTSKRPFYDFYTAESSWLSGWISLQSNFMVRIYVHDP